MARGPELSNAAFDLHMKYLKENYGNQAIVNLLGSSLVGKLQKIFREIEYHEIFLSLPFPLRLTLFKFSRLFYLGSKEGEATLSTAFQTHHKLCNEHLGNL